MRKIDIAAGLILIGLAASIAFETADLPYWTTFAPGPAFAAFWVAGAGAFIGATLVAQAVFADSGEAAEWPDGTGARNVVWGTAALWLLFAMLPYLGTAASGLIFMLVFLLLIARRPLLPSIFASVLTIAAIETIFVFWLNIKLPKGVFGI